jgi:hypothetical protein
MAVLGPNVRRSILQALCQGFKLKLESRRFLAIEHNVRYYTKSAP